MLVKKFDCARPFTIYKIESNGEIPKSDIFQNFFRCSLEKIITLPIQSKYVITGKINKLHTLRVTPINLTALSSEQVCRNIL